MASVLAGEEDTVPRVLADHPAPGHSAAVPALAHPSPAGEPIFTERDALLGRNRRRRTSRSRSTSVRRKLPWYKQANPFWVLPVSFIFFSFMGGLASAELEIFTEVACRDVEASHFVAEPVTSPLSIPPLAPDLPGSPYRTFLGFRLAVEPDREWAKQCRQSARVQQRTTSYITVVNMLTGITSAVTSGAWGAMSDLRGRNFVLALSTFGSVLGSFGYILAGTYPEQIGFKTIVVTNVGEGLLGGGLLSMSIVTAYISDVTDDGSRTSIFSVNEGVRAAGLASGPILASLLIRATGLVLSPYYASLIIRVFEILLLILIVPESLSLGRRRAEKERQVKLSNERAAHYSTLKEEHKSTGLIWLWMAILKSKIVDFFSPLALVIPRRIDEVPDDATAAPRVGNGRKRDWNLTFVFASFAFFYAVASITAVKIIWARSRFDWGAEDTGWFISFISICKLVFLFAILPWMIKIFKSTPPLPARPRPTEASSDEELTFAQETWDEEATKLKKRADASFDLKLARVSIFVAILGYAIMIPPSGSPGFFLGGSAVVACAGGAPPALQSLALTLASPRDAGKLLATLSVLGSITLLIIGPPFFGLVYVWTVGWFSEAIFLAAILWFVLALLPTFTIRLPKWQDNKAQDV